MNYSITEESLDRLHDYAEIPIRFEVRSVFEIEGDDPSTAVLLEKPVAQPWVKDYDAIEGEGPTRWPKRWNVGTWGLLAARVADTWVGGCVLAYNTDGVNKLEGRDDIVAIWDLRVHPDWRRKGVGGSLFTAAIKWARARHCRQLKIETQNINVPACRFYEKQGCRLAAINHSAYEEFPDEAEFIWSYPL